MLTSRFGFGYGMGYSSYKEATALVSLGHSVTVVHCYNNPEIVRFYDSRITCIYLPMKKIPIVGFLLYAFKLKKFFNKELSLADFDCVYIQSLEFGLLDLSKEKVPVFYYARSTMRGLRGALRNEGERMSFLAKIVHLILVALERRCICYSKKIFVKSRHMAKEVACLYGVNPDKLAIITGGIDEIDFRRQSTESRALFKQEHGIPLNVPIVLYAGRVVPQKGLIYLVEASLELLREMNFIVVIAGAVTDESYYTKIKRRIDCSSNRGSFYFLGHIDQRDMSIVFNSTDCLVTPSVYEPFGMVNLQAAFLGKSVIATDITGSTDLLTNYEKLKIVHAGSSAAIESALPEVLSWKDQRASFDFQSYSWTNVAKQLTRYFLTIS